MSAAAATVGFAPAGVRVGYSPRPSGVAATMEAGEFTQLLAHYRAGQHGAQDRLIALIHTDLRRLARRHLSGNRWIATLNTTALVNESYLRLVSPSARHVETRAHFLNLAARVMRQIVCDYARKRLREAQSLDRSVDSAELGERLDAELVQARQFVGLDQALEELAKLQPRQARVIDCRFFGGFSEEETSVALEVSLRTVQRDWNEARAWLAENLLA